VTFTASKALDPSFRWDDGKERDHGEEWAAK
jgi:hypothetical protein